MSWLTRAAAAVMLASSLSPIVVARASEPRFDFPILKDGRHVVPVDLHTHTVFSDGLVWPTVRVDEALEEGLGAVAITDHLEFSWFGKDVRSADKNRSYQIASDYAAGRIGVINGAEITRQMPPGHFIATFLKDANPVLTVAPTSDLKELKQGAAYAGEQTFIKALTAARAQGAFSFWAHPLDPPARIPGQILQPIHRRVIKDGLIQGIEVANPHWGYMSEAFDIALKYNLAVLATSDAHSPIERHDHELGSTHRSVTLALAASEGLDDIKAALLQGHTIALYNNTFYGRERDLGLFMQNALKVSIVTRKSTSLGDDLALRIENKTSVPLEIVATFDGKTQEPFGRLTIAGKQSRSQNVRVKTGEKLSNLQIKIANAYTSPDNQITLIVAIDSDTTYTNSN